MQLKKNVYKIIFLSFIFFNFLFAEEINNSSTKQLSSKNSIGDNLSSLPDKMIAGSLDIRTPSSMKRVDIKQARKDGYNVIVLAFGEVHGNNINFYSSSKSAKNLEHIVVKKIRQAKEMHMKVLIAVGGLPNTFHPGIKEGQKDPMILGRAMPDKQINKLAENIVAFLNKYNIDGIVYSFKKHTSSSLIDKLSTKLKKIDPNVIISAAPDVKDYQLVTTGTNNDYDKTIQDGNIDYIMLVEFNTYPENDPNFIYDSYAKIIKKAKIPLKTKISIVEPTTAVAGGVDTIYHPYGSSTKPLTTQQAIKLILPQLEKLRFKPRFAGVAGWSLNIDYASDLYGSYEHTPGAFAKDLRSCIYKNICAPMQNKMHGPVIASFLPLWGKNSSYNIFGKQITSKPIDLQIPKEKEYCDQYPGVCKNNVIIAAYLTYSNSQGFKLSFSQENSSSKKIYTPEQLKAFVKYMTAKNKHVLISYGGERSHIDWKTVDFSSVENIVQDYGFNGINFNLIGTEIPKNQKMVALAAKKIKELSNSLKQKVPNFWLTFSPEWDYIVAPVAKNNKDSIFVNHGYIDLLKDIGIDNINYIFLNTYAEKVADGILGFDKDKDGNYLKITPLDGYDRFLASLAWSLTTKSGYKANLSKYSKVDQPINIPADKLVFVIPATKGAVHGGMTYILTKQNINNAISLMKEHDASFAGFAIWSIDFDSMNIAKGQVAGGYTHESWATVDAITNIQLPKIYHKTIMEKKSVPKASLLKKSKQQKSINIGVINYPKNIGMYNENTVVSYQGKKYKCASKLDVTLCNDKRYIPNGSLGHLAWHKLYDSRKKKQITKKKEELINKIFEYPNNIGNYKSGQVVKVGSREYKCLIGKQKECNDLVYSPNGKKGYIAWSIISKTLIQSDDNSSVGQAVPKGADFIYPNGIKYYKGGTIVAANDQLYRCKMGPESSLCAQKVYSPLGQYADDAWVKLEDA